MSSYLQEKRPATNALMLGLLSRAVPQPDFVGMRKMYTIVGEAIAAFLQKHTSPEQCLCSIRQRLETAVRTGKYPHSTHLLYFYSHPFQKTPLFTGNPHQWNILKIKANQYCRNTQS